MSLTDCVLAHGAGTDMVKIDGEGIVVDSEGSLHLLNPQAALVWQCIDGTSSLAEIAEDIATVVGVDRHTVLDQVLTLSQELLAKNLVTLSSSTTTASYARGDAPAPAELANGCGCQHHHDRPGPDPDARVVVEPTNL